MSCYISDNESNSHQSQPNTLLFQVTCLPLVMEQMDFSLLVVLGECCTLADQRYFLEYSTANINAEAICVVNVLRFICNFFATSFCC